MTRPSTGMVAVPRSARDDARRPLRLTRRDVPGAAERCRAKVRGDRDNPICRESAATSVLADGILRRRYVHAVHSIGRDIALDPLNLRPHVTKHIERLPRESTEVVRRKVSEPRNLALDEKSRHRQSLVAV